MTDSRARVFTDGLAAGLIGYATVVVFFVVLNFVQGRSIFFTAALLGSDLFYGLETPAELVIEPGPVLAYNGLHMVLFLLAGVFMAWLAGVAERIPQGWYLGLGLFLIVIPHAFGLPIWFTGPVREELPLWYVVLATSAAAALMGLYLLAVHPKLRAQIREYRDELEED